jgi:hypothetical protein
VDGVAASDVIVTVACVDTGALFATTLSQIRPKV